MHELAMNEENVFVWYAAEGKKGYADAEIVSKTFDEERGQQLFLPTANRLSFLLT